MVLCFMFYVFCFRQKMHRVGRALPAGDKPDFINGGQCPPYIKNLVAQAKACVYPEPRT